MECYDTIYQVLIQCGIVTDDVHTYHNHYSNWVKQDKKPAIWPIIDFGCKKQEEWG